MNFCAGLGAGILSLVAACSLSGCGVESGGTGAAPIAAAQGPQLGYIWSTTEHTLRPILGIPGASQIGQSVVQAGYYTNAAATGSLALLEESTGFDLMTLPSGSPVHLSLGAPGSTTAQIRLSPSGTSAAVFIPGATAVTLVTSLSASKAAANSNQVRTLSAPAPVEDAAVSDAGSAALVLKEAGGMSLAIFGAVGTSSQSATLGSNGGLQFLAASENLLVADAAANTLSLIRNASTAPAASPVATGSLLKSPAGVAASLSGRWAVVANSGEASLVRVDLSGVTAPQRVACVCQPTLAASLANDGYFRVTGLSTTQGTPTWMVDANPATPRMLFIPALTSSSAASSATPAAKPSKAAALNGTTSVSVAVQQ